MQKYIIKLTLILTITVTMAFAIGCGNKNEKSVDSKNDNDASTEEPLVSSIFEGEHFTIDVTSDWKYDENTSYSVSNEKNTAYNIFSYVGTAQNSYNCSIYINSQDISDTGYDFDTYKDITKQSLEAKSYTISNEDDSLTIDGYNAWMFECEHPDETEESSTVYSVQVVVNVSNVMYSFTILSDTSDYETPKLSALSIFKSAKFN